MDKQKKLAWIKKATPFLYDLAIILVGIYITLRARSWANMVFPFETGFVLSLIMILYFIISLTIGKHYLVAKTKTMTYISGIITFISIYLSMSMVIADIFQLILRIFVKDKVILDTVFLWCGIIIIAFVTAATVYAMYKVTKFKILNFKMDIPDFHGSYRLVLLSDLHIGHYVGVKHIQKMVDTVNTLDADIIAISGDMINAGNTNECTELSEVEKILAKMKSKEGTFAVVGNHDPDVNNPDFQEFIRNSHIHLLEDDVYTNGRINLMGRTTKCKPRLSIKEIKSRINNNLPILAMDHDPIGINEAVNENLDLIMCGHTHKGQIFPLNLFVRFLYSKDETWGFSKKGNTVCVVTAGAGYFSMPMRLGSDCEIVCIDIK